MKKEPAHFIKNTSLDMIRKIYFYYDIFIDRLKIS